MHECLWYFELFMLKIHACNGWKKSIDAYIF